MNQGGPDPDATAFLTAIGNTDPTIDTATQNLFKDLKSNGIYTKVKAFYPMVGGTATAHKFNMVNPVDSDAAFRLTFTGSWTHSSTGALPSSAYARTYFTPSTDLSATFIGVGFYSGTDAVTNTDQIDMGVNDGVGGNLWVSIRYKGSGLDDVLARNTSNSVLQNGGTPANSFGLVQTQREISEGVSTAKLFKESARVDSKVDNGSLPTKEIYLGAFNNNGSTSFYTNRECRTAFICQGMTEAEALTLESIIQDFQTTLGRNV